jgi:hypothetical protein
MGSQKSDGDDLAPAGGSQLVLDAVVDHAAVYEVLAKFTGGGRLNKAEIATVGHLLPVEEAPYSKRVTEGMFQKTYREYEATYGKKMRTIKWWVEQGKSFAGGPDLPPLDEPKEMPAWWARVMKQRCPRPVLEAARVHAATAPPAAAESPSKKAVSPPSNLSPRKPIESLEISSQEERFQQLKEQLALARKDMLEAQAEEPQDPAKIQARQQHWRELREETDKAEEKLFRARRDAGKLVDQEEVASALMPMLATVATSIRTLIVRLKPRLRTAASDAEEDALWNSGLDECFTELVQSGFVARQHLTLN